MPPPVLEIIRVLSGSKIQVLGAKKARHPVLLPDAYTACGISLSSGLGMASLGTVPR